MTIALYFGSFNPLHIGHVGIAKYILDSLEVDELHLVPSPQNPLKQKVSNELNTKKLDYLRDAVKRFNALYFPVLENNNLSGRKELKINDIEYRLKPPYYTYNTLQAIKSEFPLDKLILVIGADNLAIIDKWFNWEQVLKEFEVWVYPRQGYDGFSLCKKYGTRYLDAPLYDISSTCIRENEANGEDMSGYKW